MRAAHLGTAALVFISMLSGTLLIPAARPFFALVHPDHEAALHAFFSVNMLGAVLGAPFLSWLADRSGMTSRWLTVLAVGDGVLLVACALPMPISLLLSLRALQGAVNVGVLSLVMAAASRTRPPRNGAGVIGAAVVAGIVAGAPLGTALLAAGPQAPFYAAATCSLLVAAAAPALPARERKRRPGSLRALITRTPMLRLPMLLVGAERFAVGCFVVTFSLHAHHVLGLSDRATGALFSWFLVPFAVATWPMGALAARTDRGVVLGLGTFTYGACFLVLGELAGAPLVALLALAGIASAAIYAPCLCVTAELAPIELRATAMALGNAAGTLGMLLGTAAAGIACSLLAERGLGRAEVYPWVFRMAGTVQLAAAMIAFRALRALPAFSCRPQPAELSEVTQ